MLSSLDVTYEYTTELFLTPFYQLMQTCRKWNELLTRNNKCSDRATDSSPVVESITNQQKMVNVYISNIFIQHTNFLIDTFN